MEASRPQRPEWINVVPEDRDGLHFLVGLSDYHASEKDARGEAMRHAREAFAKFTGVEVSQIDEIVRSLYGKDSDIFDATVSQQTQSKQSTQAEVSRVKAKEYYFERFEAKQAGRFAGTAYKYWILVAVPEDEYERVQAWKAKRAALKQEMLASQRNAAQKSINLVLSDHKTNHADITHLISIGEPIQALTGIQREWRRLDALMEDWPAKGEYFGGQVTALKQAQDSLGRLLNKIRSGLVIDTGRFHSILLSPEASGNTVSAWLWQKTGNGLKPVANMPLALGNDAGNVFARTKTDMQGLATFFTPELASGLYRIAIDSTSAPFNSFEAPILDTMSSVYKKLAVNQCRRDLDSAAKLSTRNLFAGPALSPLLVKKLVIGPVTYGQTQQGSDFAVRLKTRLAEQLSKIDGLHVVLPRPRTTANVAQAIRTRGITAGKVSLGSAATQATIDRADAALETNYVLLGKDVRINLALKEAGTDRLMGSASALISEAYLPEGVQLVPSKTSIPVSAIQAAGNRIKLEVTTHLGDGQTFRAGENISFFVNTERAAHLLIIYEDVEHHLIQILPNRYSANAFYSAGSTLQVPGPSDDFAFTITAPFGLEHVWAFAATLPWPALSGVDLDNGLKLLDGSFDEIVETIRRHGERYGVSYGEAHTMLTTVRK